MVSARDFAGFSGVPFWTRFLHATQLRIALNNEEMQDITQKDLLGSYLIALRGMT